MSMTPSRRTVESITLDDLAVDDRLLVVRCNYCRKTDNYLARHLVEVLGAGTSMWGAVEHCRHCGKSHWLRIATRLPMMTEVGQLTIRVPVDPPAWAWKDGVYGQ